VVPVVVGEVSEKAMREALRIAAGIVARLRMEEEARAAEDSQTSREEVPM